MAFDVSKMYSHCCKLIDQFYYTHLDETFYGFCIQFGGLHLNSIEQLEKTIENYREKYPEYYSLSHSTDGLKWSVGDWAYKHFISLEDVDGYDEELWHTYYNLCLDSDDPNLAKTTEYYKAMDELLNLIMQSDSLKRFKKTSDFKGFFIAADD